MNDFNNSVEWSYFFGGQFGKVSERYYKAEINGVSCEKHAVGNRVEYSIGNMDNAEVKYKSVDELLAAVGKIVSYDTARQCDNVGCGKPVDEGFAPCCSMECWQAVYNEYL